MIVLLAYTAYRLYYLAERYNPTVQKITLMRSPDEDLPFRPQDYGFDFSYGLVNQLDPSYGFFTAKFIEQDIEGVTRVKHTTHLE